MTERIMDERRMEIAKANLESARDEWDADVVELVEALIHDLELADEEIKLLGYAKEEFKAGVIRYQAKVEQLREVVKKARHLLRSVESDHPFGETEAAPGDE